jgi:hypothetical protein
MSLIQPRLQYNYAGIDLNTGRCRSCATYSYEINNPAFIPVPYATNDYMGKYYNINGDQMWYLDAEFTQLWEECPSHNM